MGTMMPLPEPGLRTRISEGHDIRYLIDMKIQYDVHEHGAHYHV